MLVRGFDLSENILKRFFCDAFQHEIGGISDWRGVRSIPFSKYQTAAESGGPTVCTYSSLLY